MYNFVTVFMINRVHTPTVEKDRHNDRSARIVVVLAFSLVVLGLVGWRGDWVLVYGEHAMGVLSLAWGSWG